MPAPVLKESGISQFITRESGAIPRDVIDIDAPINIVTSSTATPTVVTCLKNHGYHNGSVVTIAGHTASDDDAAMNDDHAVTVIDDTTFSVPVDLSGGAGGGTGGTVRSAEGSESGTLLVVFSAADFSPVEVASVAGPSVTNDEQLIQTRGDLNLALAYPEDSGMDADGLLQPGDVYPAKRRMDRITARLQEIYGNRFQRVQIKFIGTAEA